MAKKPKTILIEEKILTIIEKEARKQKRTVHYLMVEAVESKFGK